MERTKYKILSCAAECVPFVKTGGLADVVAAVPRYLNRHGHDCRIVLPFYRRLIDLDPERCRWFPIHLRPWGWLGREPWVVEYAPAAPHEPTIYFVENDEYFDRAGIYGDKFGEFGDNAWRYAFFAMACLALPKTLGWYPNIYHTHDWHTGLVAPMARRHAEAARRPDLAAARIVMTIHNLAYRGLFGPEVVTTLELPPEVFAVDTGEFHGAFSYLKVGLAYADLLTTVSPSYAREILAPDNGIGLDGFLRGRAGRLLGILNGIDEEEWDPETDPHLAMNYTARSLARKAENKRDLQERFGLQVRADVPMVAMISRLDKQKGYDLVLDALPELLFHDMQFVLLGSGASHYENFFKLAEAARPRQVHASIGFSNALAHKIEAGADIFLMPSMFEPCGLNQMYSMRYGTVPVVRRVGGLRDSVEPWRLDEDGASATPSATGFAFEGYSSVAMHRAVEQALMVYRLRPDVFQRLRLNGMAEDHGWAHRVGQYERVFDLAFKLPPSRPNE